MRQGVADIFNRLNGFLEALDDFARSTAAVQRSAAPSNICAQCYREAKLHSLKATDFDTIAEIGRCSHCLQVADCIDLDLIALYRSFNVSDRVIAERLPKLRRRMPHLRAATQLQILLALNDAIDTQE